MRPAELFKLANLRKAPRRDFALGLPLATEFKNIQARHRQLGKIGAAWSVVVPDDIKAACAVVSCSRGVLTIRACDHAARFEFDRWLRSGGKDALAAAGGKLKSVKVLCS